MLFYVRRQTCADGSFEWYVLMAIPDAARADPFGRERRLQRSGKSCRPSSTPSGDRREVPPKITHVLRRGESAQTKASRRAGLVGHVALTGDLSGGQPAHHPNAEPKSWSHSAGDSQTVGRLSLVATQKSPAEAAASNPKQVPLAPIMVD
jgi:hypothetical protein